jgi:septum formation protein
MEQPRIILASASPRRRELLGLIRLPFEVVASHIEEVHTPGETVEEYVSRLATDKAGSISSQHPTAWVLAADTVVYLDGKILEKPVDAADAQRMLRSLAGRRHTVYSGVCLRRGEPAYKETTVVQTFVDMGRMSESDIEWYVATGEPLDKAGAYAVQGIGSIFIDGVAGNFTNVVGLPLSTVAAMFQRASLPLTQIVRC